MERIGKYVIHKAAITTGYAQVIFCHDPDLKVPVAIKMFDPRRLEGGPQSPAQLMARFINEAQVMASFDHQAIVPVKTMEHLSDGRPFFVMPYLAAHLPWEIGRDINDPAAIAAAAEQDKPRKLSVGRSMALLRLVASALVAIHRRGMVHRHLKPSNLLLTAREGGGVKLADFSMVKLPERNLPMPDHWSGDTAYCAPEQRENATAVGPQADVYSFGVLAYRLLTGHLLDPSVGAADLPQGFAEPLSALVRQCTDPDPERRPAHAAALLPLLEAVPRVIRPTVEVVVRKPSPAAPATAG